MSTQDIVYEILLDNLGIDADELTPRASLVGDFGCDSLDVVELIMAFEDRFDLQIYDEDIKPGATVGDLVAYFERRQQERTRA